MDSHQHQDVASAIALRPAEPGVHQHAMTLDLSTTIRDSVLASPVIAGLFTGLLARQRSPWLIIVVRFKDDPRTFDRLPKARRSTCWLTIGSSSPRRARAP